ncbi:phosphate signaling complex protein PhoU [Pseudothauera nasutitermitis]|uniref:Phosphate-specific transport system accessory protein PhoU n=1 Tax=Pseudothauera nasutitermitis TaxID=2565930 RepID=A0A4S4ARG4_9RHOO|nr:phosphate signaling complex protein PhoU [Pseudothauera nasutitermitis]THF62362.1 phosphate signaling complex protein PhoU [Pseudothauera nasutitermitis]
MSEHIYKQFDADLEAIRSGVLQMGGLVESQLTNAFAGLKNADKALIEKVIAGDHRINLLEVDIDEACSQLIAKRQPAASDLRSVLGAMKTVTDLERIGDEAKKIAKAARRLHSGDLPYSPRVDLGHPAALATDMVRKALDSFARSDVTLAPVLAHMDDEVDTAFEAVTRQLITYMMEDPRTISNSLETLFIAKSIERVGDHALNISEYVIYMAHGRDVRYAGTAVIEQEAAREIKKQD